MGKDVDFDLFASASPAGHALVSLWHRRAKIAGEKEQYDVFDAFTRLWTGFNQWGMRVTESDHDADMVGKVAASPSLNAAFADLLLNDDQFSQRANSFSRFWPIFDVRDLRKKGLRHKFSDLPRAEYVKKMLSAEVRRAPRGEFDPSHPSWDNTLSAAYRVRCNLAHGEKGDASDDYQIVEATYRVLLAFVDCIDLYDWPASEVAHRFLKDAKA